MINTDIPFFNELISILDKEVIKNINNDLQNIYKNWNLENKINQFNSIPVIRKKHLLRYKNQIIPIEKVKLLGVDLPSWYGDFKSKNKIMIIGIDPMRGEKDFVKANANKTEELIIGTPYAFHIKAVRENFQNKNYTQFINSLILDNNFVYLTDIYKTFFYTDINKENNFIRSYDYYGKFENIRNTILASLLKEIRLVNPTIIITFGGISFNKLTLNNVSLSKNDIVKNSCFFKEEIFKEFKHIPIYPFMHPGRGTYKKNLVDFVFSNLGRTESDDFGNLFFEIIKKYEILNND